MSLPLTPYERWESGTNQNSVPANNNSLRDEIFNTDGIADDVTAQPGSPADGDWYIIPAAATGTQWATFAEDSVAIFYGGNWYEFVPAEGNKVSVSASLLIYDGSGGWQSFAPPGTGDVVGPASATADAVAVFDGTTGKLLKDGVLLSKLRTQSIQIACSDETTALTTGTAKVTFRMPYAFTLTAVRASLTTAQTSGSIFTVDINEGGSTILSTKLTIDNTEKTSTTAATAPVISDASLADDAEITIDIDQIGDGTAKGLKVALIGYAT